MANTINQLTKRSISLLLGLLMFTTSLYLLITIHVSIYLILYTLNPYPLYAVGLIFGFERIYYGVSGNSKLLSFLMGEIGEYSSMSTLALFTLLLTFGIYILAYTIAYTQILIQVANSLNGLSYLLFSFSVFKAWHK